MQQKTMARVAVKVKVDIGSIVGMEHVNLTIPDQGTATEFYVVGLGYTRDPYLSVGLENMWVNVGEQQFHLPTRPAQVIPGHIGVVVPSLEGLQKRLKFVEPRLAGTRFSWSAAEGYVEATCPWGNRFRCYAPSRELGNVAMGIPYVEFLVKPGAAAAIGRFYERATRAPAAVTREGSFSVAEVRVGEAQHLRFRETAEPLPPYDGHHIAIYIDNLVEIYSWFQDRGLVMEELVDHQFRFKHIVDPDTGEKAFKLEHEVRGLRHPMYRRGLVNRDPVQRIANYVRGREALRVRLG